MADILIQLKDIQGNPLYPKIRTGNVINDAGFLAVSDSGTAGQYLMKTSQGPRWADIEGSQLVTKFKTFTEAPQNLVTFQGLNIPVGVETSLGNYYPMQKGSLTISDSSVTLDVTPYLAYDDASSFEGTWRAWFSAGHQTSDSVDLSDYYNKDQIDEFLQDKLDTASNTGTPGQVLTKTASGHAWLTVTPGPGSDSTVNLVTISFTSQSQGVVQWSDSTVIFKGCTSVPVGVRTSLGNYYPVQKGSVGIGGQGSWLNVVPYLAYDDTPSFQGTWTAYFASGEYQKSLVQFSQLGGSDSWEGLYVSNKRYVRLSGDGGSTWSGAMSMTQVPVGSVIAFSSTVNSLPYGWLLCDGSSLLQSDYPQLYAVLGTIYNGSSVQTGYFKLPDFRGSFLRGYKSGTSAELGTQQGDAIRNITGKQANIYTGYNSSTSDYGTPTGTSALYGTTQGLSAVQGATNKQILTLNFDVSRNVPTASQNRPVNYAVNYIIKYR